MTLTLRRNLTLLALLGSLAATSCSDRRPNLVLLTLDTVRADALSSYGHPRRTTPHLDSLFEGGALFEFAIATASVTNVSHASILTGLDNPDHGVRVLSAADGYRLPGDVPTLATVLREAGYRAIAVHSAFPVSKHFGFERGFDIFESLEASIRQSGDGPGSHSWEVGRHQRRADATTDLVMKHLRRLEEPFFLWVHYWDPHDATVLPPESHRPPDSQLFEMRDGERVKIRPNPALYEAEVRYMDLQIGRLLTHLRERGWYDDSVIAAVGDHGQGLGDHDWEGHRLLYQEQIRVPLLLRVPGGSTQNRVDELVRTTDLLPTLLDYLGIEEPDGLSGISLRDLVDGRGAIAPDRLAFADQINGYDLNARMVLERPLDDFLYSALDRRWKLIYRPTRPEKSELYDLRSDPREARNLYEAGHPQAIRLEEALAERAGWVTTAPGATASIEPDVREALASLGYTTGETRTTDIEWAWTCPEHKDFVSSRATACPHCHRRPVLIARPDG